jgi:integrase
VIEHFWPSYSPVALRRHEAVELNFGHIQPREEHWAIVDPKEKAGHTRTIPMPGWVKNVVDQWILAANITSGKLFRRVHKMGKTWGERLTEKAVWHVVREYATKAGIEKSAPHDLRRTCARLCYATEANWSKSSFCSVTFRFRPPSDISVRNSGFKVPSTTKSE